VARSSDLQNRGYTEDVLDFLTTRLRFYGVKRSSAMKRRAGRLRPLQSLVAVGEYFAGACRDR
jgi:hypothetical protein